MKCYVKVMFLASHSGTKENGDIYYYGSFLDLDSKKNFNLYFNNMDYLKQLKEMSVYEIPIKFNISSIINNSGQRVLIWKISFDESVK